MRIPSAGKMSWLGAVLLLVGVGGCFGPGEPDTVAPVDVLYVAFGNSTTAGPSERDYPDILREKLGEPQGTFANEGHGGETSTEGLERLQELIDQETYPEAHTLLYWEGGNNITDFIEENEPLLLMSPADEDYSLTDELTSELDGIQEDVEAAIEAGQGAGMTVYVATYYLIREDLAECDALPLDIIYPDQARNANDYVVLLNERIRLAVDNTGATLVDVEAEDESLRSDPDNYYNCNHLSAQGNEIVADLFAEQMQ
ncbi:MAG: hypothetical protein JSU63_13380 [Phycisphaerales bacterium]|nr:MAG: hypothetical protein JSU63_13380 [Phycisphaerales bacterium]